jgi:hypothetical protein
VADLISGLVVAVDDETAGSQTVLEALAGETVLTVDDAIDFDSTGGQLSLADGTVLDYIEANDDEDTITLAAPLAAPVEFESDVLVYPPQFTRTALVVIDGGSDPIPATVPHDKQDVLAPGVRDEENANREEVLLIADGDWSWSVFDVTNKGELLRDGAAIWNPHAIRDAPAVNLPNDSWTTISGYSDVKVSGITVTSSEWIIGPHPGFYSVTTRYSFSNNSTSGRRGVRVMVNGVEESAVVRPADSGRTYMLTIADVNVAEGDVITVQAWQNSGASLAAGASVGAGRERISVARMSI